MGIAATYLLGTGLASLVTAAVLLDRGKRRGGYRFWLAGVALTVAGMALTAVVDFKAHQLVHAVVTLVIAAVSVALVASTRLRGKRS